MADDIRPEIIKRTQDILGKHIKKPPLTEKLLKKPPFRFLHDVINSVIRETGFLQGVFTSEELNHENIKDRDGKISFLQKAIDAVKTITGIQLTIRPSKVVAGHEPTKTNEFLQAIGKALDKKLDSSSYVAKPTKEKATKNKEEGSKLKSRSNVMSKSQSREKSRSRDAVRKKSSGSTMDKPSKTSKQGTEPKENKPVIEAGPVADNTSERPVRVVPMALNESVSGEKPEKSEVPIDIFPETQVEHTVETEAISQQNDVESPLPVHSPLKQINEKENKEEFPDEAAEEIPVSNSPKKVSHNERKRKPAKSNDAQMEVAKETNISDADRKETGTPIEIGVFGSKTISSDVVPESTGLQRIASARPRTARPASARPAAPRIRDRGEVVVQEETRLSTGKVHVITDSDTVKEQDEFENFVVEETSSIVSLDQESAPPTSVPPSSGDQGHLVAQILETQKELEDDSQFSFGDKDKQAKRVEIEWETGQRREKELASKEVDRLRASIQTLTRAANPLGKLMDFLQEDVDAMQRELELWKTTNEQLQVQLLEEQRLTEESVEPMKVHLQQLQHSITEKLDEISALKATILRNDMKTQKLVTGGSAQQSDRFG